MPSQRRRGSPRVVLRVSAGHFGDAHPDTPRDVEECPICKNPIGMSPSRELSCGDRIHINDCWESYVEDSSQRAFEAAAE